MSYFEDQMEAWEDSGHEGNPTDVNPDEYWADKIDACDHDKIKTEKVGGKRRKVCQECDVIL